MSYPNVVSEWATLAHAHAGGSIARYGDGELKMALGRSACAQAADPRLAKILRTILADTSGDCLPCIPNIAVKTAKDPFWTQYRAGQYTRLYTAKGPYGSAFVSRPDSAPWIDTEDYWASVSELWNDREVVLVRGSGKSLKFGDLHGAAKVQEILCTPQNAFVYFDELVEMLKGEKRRVLLCLGPTATALAWELSKTGVHALDLGHVGMFMRRRGLTQQGSANAD